MAGRERLFFGYVAVVGIAALSLSAPFLADLPGFLVNAPAAFWLCAALAVLCAAVPVEFGTAPVYPSTCFAVAALLSWGVGPAVAVQAAAVAVVAVRLRWRPWRGAFAAGRGALAVPAAQLVGHGAIAGLALPGAGNSWGGGDQAARAADLRRRPRP